MSHVWVKRSFTLVAKGRLRYLYDSNVDDDECWLDTLGDRL